MSESEKIQQETELKERHGCVSAWLIIMIIANAMMAVVYFWAQYFMRSSEMVKISRVYLIILGILGLVNAYCAVLLLKWKKIGFWGFIGSTVIAFIVNYTIGLDRNAFSGLLGVLILFAVLQIKRKQRSAWENMD